MSAASAKRRVALVTGGGGGVGRATAMRLAEAGYDVAILGRTRPTLDEAAVALRGGVPAARFAAVVADVADRAQVTDAVAQARRELGPVAVLVNAAGVAESAALLPPDDALFDRAIAVNARGAWIVSTACLPDMIASKWGRIVNVASTAALQGFRYVAAYVASKHALLGLTRAMAKDLEGKGVTVNAVCPGFLDTPMTERTIARIVATTGRTREEALSDVLRSGEQTHLIPPSDVADAIVSLCRPEASGLTGAAVPV